MKKMKISIDDEMEIMDEYNTLVREKIYGKECPNPFSELSQTKKDIHYYKRKRIALEIEKDLRELHEIKKGEKVEKHYEANIEEEEKRVIRRLKNGKQKRINKENGIKI